MSFSPIEAPGITYEYKSTNPVVEARIIEDLESSVTTIKLKFRIAVQAGLLLEEGLSKIIYFIEGGKTGTTYRYFSGDTESMESDILGWAASKYESESSHASEAFSSYFYSESSIYSFIPDKVLASVDPERWNRSFEYQAPGSTKESSIPLTFYAPQSATIKQIYRETSAVNSRSTGLSCYLPFPRLTANESFNGKRDSQAYSISSNFDQLKFYFRNVGVSVGQKLKDLDNLVENTDYWPITLEADLEFEESERGILNSLLVKDRLKLQVRFSSDEAGTRNGIQPISFSLREALVASSAQLDPLVVTVTPPSKQSSGFDNVKVVNNNECSVKGRIGLYGYSEALDSMTKSFHHTFIIPPRSEVEIPMPESNKFPSRFYQGYGTSAIFESFSSLVTDPASHPPQVAFEGYIPSISNNNSPDKSDPQITAILDSSQDYWEIYVSKIPPYIEEVCFYARPIRKKGPGSYRSPGSSRSKKSGWAYILTKPEDISQKLNSNQVSFEFPVTSISKESGYEILADLKIKDCVVDTISTPIYNPKIRGIKGYVNCDFSVSTIPGDYSSDTLTISSQISSTSDGIIDSLISQTTLSSEYLESFNESMAESTINVWYKVYRYNIGGKRQVEDMGYFNDGTHRIPVSSDSSLTRKYVAKVYALTIGQLLPSNPPVATSPAWPGAGGGSQQYYRNYAKYSSVMSEVHDKLPNDSYLSTANITQNAFTGHQIVSTVTSVDKVKPVTASELNIEYNQAFGIRYLSWSIDESLANHVPEYYIVSATYGGVTAPVTWALNSVGGSSIKNFVVCDKKLGNAIGKTTYRIYAVYMDGELQDTGLSANYTQASNKLDKSFNLR